MPRPYKPHLLSFSNMSGQCQRRPGLMGMLMSLASPPQFTASPWLFSLLYVSVCGLFLFKMRLSPDKANRVIFKALPFGILFGAAASRLADGKVLSIKNADFLPRVYTLGGGMVFYCMSWVYLEFGSLVGYGYISYIVALGIFIYGFSSSFQLFKDYTNADYAVLGVLLLLSVLIFLYVLSQLPAWYIPFLLAQLVLLSSLVSIQFSLLSRKEIPMLYLGTIGSVFLYVSDVLRAIGTWRVPFKHFDTICMGLSYAAMLLLFNSTMVI